MLDGGLGGEQELLVMGEDQVLNDTAVLFAQADCVGFEILWLALVNLYFQSLFQTQVTIIFQLN